LFCAKIDSLKQTLIVAEERLEAGMKSRWVNHKGVRIFIADFSGYGSNSTALRAECNYVIHMLRDEPLHSVISVSNVEDTFANEDVIRALVELASQTNTFIKKRAVIGVSGFRRHFLDVFSKVVGDLKFSVFDTLEQALDWLAEG